MFRDDLQISRAVRVRADEPETAVLCATTLFVVRRLRPSDEEVGGLEAIVADMPKTLPLERLRERVAAA